MQSLKQVLEMKNQQIHLQEKKIIELEKLVSWPCSLQREGGRDSHCGQCSVRYAHPCLWLTGEQDTHT